MRLIHLANHVSTNIGNGALVLGAERVLAEDVDPQTQFVPDNWDAYSQGLRQFDRDFVERVNTDSDGLLVGAAVSLNGDARYANAGMRFDLPYELWPSVRVPVIFYAVSHRWNPGGTYHHRDQLRRALEYVLDSPRALFSVRNDGTKEWLESLLGFASERIVAIPDPAMYVPTIATPHIELENGRANILVSLNNEDEKVRFGPRSPEPREPRWTTAIRRAGRIVNRVRGAERTAPAWRRNQQHFISQLASALERIARERPVNFIFCPHYFFDYKLMEEVLRKCPWRVAHELAVSSGIPRATRAAPFYDLYAKADAALSMRVHSMTPAVGLGTPLVGLVCDPRMSAFLSDTGLEAYGVDVLDPDLGEKVHRRLTYALDHGVKVRQELAAVRATMRDRTRAYNERIARLFQ